ncbi:DUF3500 domain-containing protein [Streptomyces sp. NPDC050560]|uniref:DUF3500 domain-containing protein n=1 Tax=Streptomyces sp. NPDC050560 TaxID=3365630 RepID=UPI003790503A
MTGLRDRGEAPTRRPAVWTPELIEKIEWRRRAAHEPFRGVAGSGGPRAGLFPLRTTGADVRALTAAAERYLTELTDRERAEGRFALDHESWRHWANGARYFLRHGLCLEDLDGRGRELALDVLRRSLSDYGFRLVVDLMHLNLTIGELRGEEHLLNEWLYWFSVYGAPERGEPWGWQLDGHHVNINCVVVGDQMVLTPTFLGAEPVAAEGGVYAGTTVFRREESLGRELFASLDDRQLTAATLAPAMPDDLFAGAFRDNLELDCTGLRFDELNVDQRDTARELLGLYVGRAEDQQAKVRAEEVRAHESETRLSWVGDTEPGGVFYYRVHSPVILVEFEHQAGVMFDNDTPSPRHIHTVVRTPNGNDYGVDLLRQHHERHHGGNKDKERNSG